MSNSLRALRRANPRGRADFTESVHDAVDVARTRIAASIVEEAQEVGEPTARIKPSHPRRRFAGVSAALASLVAVAAVVFMTFGSPGGGPGIESAAAAFKEAAAVTAASAEESGTAVVRMTHNGEVWAGKTIRWNNGDVEVLRNDPLEPEKPRVEFLVVDGILYGIDPGMGGWVEFGSPDVIDPDSGTTPAEHLAAVQEDIGGKTLRRITEGMTGLTTRSLDDGSTVYSGAVAAGLIARETGFKEGQHIRVLPFGYVAHDEAEDPASHLDVAVTVGPDGIVREISVTWPAWTYTVTYSELGTTRELVAPANPRSIEEIRTPSTP